MNRRFVLLVTSSLTSLMLGGCGAAPGSMLSSAVPGPSGEGLPDPRAPAEQRVYDLVAKEHLDELYALVGRFAQGEASIYRGSCSARDNLSSLGRPDGVLDSTNVLASLAWDKTSYLDGRRAGGWALTVYGPNQDRRVMLHQYPDEGGVTRVSLVTARNTGFGVSGSCVGCVPPLANRPDMLTIAPLVANGKYGTGDPLRVSASGSLTAIPAAQLTFDDLVGGTELFVRQRDPAKAFVSDGAEMVERIQRELHEKAAVPAGKAFAECHLVTTYGVERYVSRVEVAKYGLRKLRIEKVQTCCVDRPDLPCEPGHRTCF